MKKYLFLIVVLGFAAQAVGQQASAQSGAVISFEKSNHSFGDIFQGDKVEQVFKFTNTGSEPLVITNVEVSCGCTVPKWPRDPIPPGAKGELTVVFNSAGKKDLQTKVVTVISNASNSDQAKITFTANVLEKKLQPNN